MAVACWPASPTCSESFRPVGDHVSKDIDSVLEDDTCENVHTRARAHAHPPPPHTESTIRMVFVSDKAQLGSSYLHPLPETSGSHLGRDSQLPVLRSHFTFSKAAEASREWAESFDNSPTASYSSNHRTVCPSKQKTFVNEKWLYFINKISLARSQVTLSYILSIAFSVFSHLLLHGQGWPGTHDIV